MFYSIDVERIVIYLYGKYIICAVASNLGCGLGILELMIAT